MYVFFYALLSRERGSYRIYHETGFLVTVSVDDATETVVEGEVELEVRGGAGITEYHLPQSHWSVALVNPTTHTHTHTHTIWLERHTYYGMSLYLYSSAGLSSDPSQLQSCGRERKRETILAV